MWFDWVRLSTRLEDKSLISKKTLNMSLYIKNKK